MHNLSKLNLRKILLPLILGVAVLTYTLWDANNQLTSLSLTFIFKAASPQSWLLTLAVVFFRDLFYVFRLKYLLNELTWSSAWFCILMWEFSSAISPGIVGGAGVAMFFMYACGIPLARGTAAVMITALFDNLFYISVTPLALLIAHGMNLNLLIDWWLIGGYFVFMLVALILAFGIFWSPSTLKSILFKLSSNRILSRFKSTITSFASRLHDASMEYKTKNLFFWLVVFGFTFGSWMSRFAAINCVAELFTDFSWQQHLALYINELKLWIVLIVVPLPGGIGMAEWVFQELLQKSLHELTGAAALTWRLFTYYPYLLIGSLVIIRQSGIFKLRQ